ncbi:hypothetical protein M422DRAFT_173615, partial [Sphaerobolus stellatus SS14]
MSQPNIANEVLEPAEEREEFREDYNQFWTQYKYVAEEHDEEFLERHTTNLDSLLIFAGLFSAVSSAFIVQMESGLTPDPTNTTNDLLFQLIQIIDNSTTIGLDVPVSADNTAVSMIWIQAISYVSLSTSLLAAFGAVIAKQ